MELAASVLRAGITMILIAGIIEWVIAEPLTAMRALGIAAVCTILSGMIAVVVLAWRGLNATIDR